MSEELKLEYTDDEISQISTARECLRDAEAKVGDKFKANSLIQRIERSARKRAEGVIKREAVQQERDAAERVSQIQRTKDRFPEEGPFREKFLVEIAGAV